jgi:hypothetical protein
MALPSVLLFLLFSGENRLQRVTGFGDVGEINLGRNRLGGTRGCAAGMAGGPRAATEMRADLFGLVLLQRAGVGLALGQAEFRQYVKDLSTLDFHLACKIVNSNLTHPPLFDFCFSKPLVAHSCLVALAAADASIIV